MRYLLLLVLLTGCSPARVVLNAPETAAPGEIVILDASESNVSVCWYSEADFEIIGKKAIFCTNDIGTYTFLVMANNKVVVHKVEISKESVSLIKSWLPKNLDLKVVNKLANSFERIASAEHTDLTVFMATTAISNRVALGDSLDKWKPFLTTLVEYLEENFNDKSVEEHTEMWFKIAAELRSIK